MKPNSAKSLLILCAVGAAGCTNFQLDTGLAGSGVPATETRKIAQDFTKVSDDGAANVYIKVGGKVGVTVEGDDNIVPLVKTDVKDSTLYIDTKRSVRPKKKLVVTITMPNLDEVQLDGAGNITVSNLRATNFKVGLDGAGNIEVDGTASSLRATLDGAGNLKLEKLQVQDADVSVDGAGNLDLWATHHIKAELNGVGNIHYKGSPTIEKDVSGVGRISGGE